MTSDLSYRICRMRAADGGAKLIIELACTDGTHTEQKTVAVLAARLSRLPAVGEISFEAWEELEREADVSEAIGAGLRALGAGGCSTRHLEQKLRQRGFASDIAKEAAAVLAEKGYLREEEGALREAEKGMAKLWGDRRILAELSAKGYTGGALKYAAARLTTEDGVARCVRLLQKRHTRKPRDANEAGRLFAALTRYGYTATEIKKALQIAMK